MEASAACIIPYRSGAAAREDPSGNLLKIKKIACLFAGLGDQSQPHEISRNPILQKNLRGNPHPSESRP